MGWLLIILISSLLPAGAWAQPSGKGVVANCPTVTITAGDCAGTGTGTRAFDTTLNVEVTFDGTSWNPSGVADIVITTTGTDSPSSAEMLGTMHIADHATATSDVDYTLPEIGTAATATVVTAGASACFYDNGGGTGGIIIDPNIADVILLDGVPLAAGDEIHSPGVAGDGTNGDYICLLAIDATNWITTGRSGVWVDGVP